MRRIAATGAKNRLGAILDEAQREPIIIRRRGRDVAVVLSMAHFQRMEGGNIQAFMEARKLLADDTKASGLTAKRLLRLVAEGD